MPELPEVETIRRTLVPHLVGQEVREVRLLTPLVWRGLPPSCLGGLSILELTRRGKHLFVHFSGDMVLHVHLGMTGRLIYNEVGHNGPAGGTGQAGAAVPLPGPDRHVHVVLLLTRGELHYWDQRRFGYLELGVAEDVTGLSLGPEPVDVNFDTGTLARILEGRRAPVKSVLLDQHRLAGVGNIYADESLWRSGILPFRAAGSLTGQEIEVLARALREVLKEAIARRGTTFSDYRDGEGRPGDFGSRLSVYGRVGEPCPRCGTAIERTKVAGRGTYFCPRCQK